MDKVVISPDELAEIRVKPQELRIEAKLSFSRPTMGKGGNVGLGPGSAAAMPGSDRSESCV
jgi:hypothetical protein